MARRRRKERGPQATPRRFPGLTWAAAALGVVSAVVALIYLLPLPVPLGPHARPPFEEPHPPPPPTSHPSPPSYVRPESVPRVAFLIDDLGYDLAIDRAFLSIDAPLSFAFLPGAPHTQRLVREARNKGRDILVHLPMEPLSPAADSGPGALRTDMALEPLLRLLRQDIEAVPGAMGVNNHMGSRFTANRGAMELVLAEVKRRGLFFVDSRTTSGTVAYETARSLGVPAIERSVFLDHDPRPEAVRRELNRLVRLAQERGQALAIGHPLSVTLRVLYEELPRLQKEVRVVPVHRLAS